MFQSTYYIDKLSNTFADNLAVFGLAFVLNGVADGRARVRIEDTGAVFAVVCEPAIREKWVEEVPILFWVRHFSSPLTGKLKRKSSKEQH